MVTYNWKQAVVLFPNSWFWFPKMSAAAENVSDLNGKRDRYQFRKNTFMRRTLFTLPNDCLLRIFLFLDLREVGRMDTCSMNRRARETLLDVLKTLTLPRVALGNSANDSCIRSLRYLLLREIIVKEVIFFWSVSDVELVACAEQLLIQPLKGLTSIKLSGCLKITDTTLSGLAGGCRGLTSLDLCGCGNVTDAGLASLGVGCAGLT